MSLISLMLMTKSLTRLLSKIKAKKKVTFWKDFVLVLKTIRKAFVKKENIDRAGFATDEDYGDYLLRTGKISQSEYDAKIELAEEMLSNYEK